MLFNSLSFAVFFPVVTLGFFLLPQRFRWFWLLCASCAFYMAFIPAYILILFLTIGVDYAAGILMEKENDPVRRRLYLVVSLVVTVAILFVFKYFNFFNANLAAVAAFFHWNYGIASLSIILPIGLSFHTFQSMSYVIEVYRGNQKSERHFGIYALYVMFYPQLVAGPIERPQNLLHQFRETYRFDPDRFTSGAKRIAWGLFKKMVIADRLALYVNQTYGAPEKYSGVALALATVFFAFQIYCDFSGYSDIAIGSARVMGFRLMENFRSPYFSQSIAEFWKRWHISLSTWFRDYLYISLGGSRVSRPKWYWNLFVTFLISGVWHGANWTYIIWGGLNGFYLVFALWTAEARARLCQAVRLPSFPILHAGIRVLTTFALITVAWIFFRASSVSDAFVILRRVCAPTLDGHGLWSAINLQGSFELLLSMTLILLLVLAEAMRGVRTLQRVYSRSSLLRHAAWSCLIVMIALFGVFQRKSDFIYFQF